MFPVAVIAPVTVTPLAITLNISEGVLAPALKLTLRPEIVGPTVD